MVTDKLFFLRGALWVGAVLLLVSLGHALWRYYVAEEEHTPLSILAMKDPKNQLPVYAQFVVTQEIHLASAIYFQELRVPLYLPPQAEPIKVSLYRNGRPVYAWKTSPIFEGSGEMHFRLPQPMLVDGDLEVRFDGHDIVHDRANYAPSVYTEDDNAAFNLGNYRIAENAKEGDISMSFVGTRPRFVRLAQQRTYFWPATVSRIVMIVLLGMLVMYMPGALTRPFQDPS